MVQTLNYSGFHCAARLTKQGGDLESCRRAGYVGMSLKTKKRVAAGFTLRSAGLLQGCRKCALAIMGRCFFGVTQCLVQLRQLQMDFLQHTRAARIG